MLVAGTEQTDIEAGKYGRMWIKYIQIKDCRAEAFCSRWSKVCRGFEEVSSVTG